MITKKHFLRFLAYLLGVIIVTFKANAYKNVEVEGLLRFSKDSVISNLKYSEKTIINEDDISDEVKNIYSLGLFSDVSATYDNGNLKIKVVEVPVIAGVKFNGLKAFKKDIVLPELSTKERGFYSKASVIADAKKLETIYKSSGILDASVEPMIEFLEGGKIYVIFNISEGEPKKIRKIFIDGNQNFSDYTLKEQLFIKEKAFYRFFSSRTTYNISSTVSELERLRTFYLQKGYAKTTLDYKIVTLNEENTVDINIFITEREKYTFGDYAFINNIPNLKGLEDKKLIEFKKGKTYNIDLIEKTKYNIKKLLSKQGFMFAEVIVKYNFNDDKKIADVIFTINPTRRVYVDKIKIAGNLKTEDKVIRREFLVSEGDVYDGDKIRRSIQRLRGLGIFDKVEVKETQTAEDRIELLIEIQEGRTLTADFQLGYDFGSDISVSVSLNEANFLGKGIGASVSVEKGRYSSGITLSLIEPYLFDRDLTFVSAFGYSSNKNPNFNSYQSESIFQSLKGIYSISEYLRHAISYQIKLEKLEILDKKTILESTPLAIEQEGIFVTSSVSQALTYDRRDNRLLPNNGYLLEFSQEVAGLGGDIFYLSHGARFEQYFELFGIDNSVLGFKLKGKTIMGINNETVKIKDRLKLGSGYGLRGFDFTGIQPRFRYTENGATRFQDFSYGGKNLFLGNVEYRFPNFLPAEFGFVTFIFFDFGTVFGYEDPSNPADFRGKYEIVDSKMMRTSAGIGVSWSSPIGMIVISYAKPLRYTEFDEQRRFFLNIGGMTF
jgi:outer membrane protein insertion porin family